ncbi:MAG: SCO family protein [Bacteroidota bacterium]
MKPSIYRLFFIAVLLFALISCEEDQRLKKYYPIGVGEVNWDTIYQTVPAFNMLNQQVEPVSRDKMDGRIRIFHFYCGDCENSPAAFQQMADLQNSFQEDTLIYLISMSLTPSKDDTLILKALGETYEANTRKWDILSGDSLITRKIAESGFHVYFEATDSISRAPEVLVLIDKEGRVRGKYQGVEDGVAKLKEDILVLKEEYVPKYDWWRIW